ncbi:MAG TPA: hypothetical protein VLM89_10860 [Phycisphaerae bacterium]|nr:hypothetical protein [Phycisphaerae bacterium]
MQSFLLILGLAVLVVVSAVTLITRRREAQTLRAFAARRRLNFSSEDLIDLHARYYPLAVIRRGRNRFAWNLLYGTTDEGLVSLFCYRYDLGFGVNQVQRAWWLAVIETSRNHPGWQARRDSAGAGDADESRHRGRLGDFTLTSDQDDVLERLREIGIETFLREKPDLQYVEAHGQLVVVAAAYDRDPRMPAHLLDAVSSLVRLLDGHRI